MAYFPNGRAFAALLPLFGVAAFLLSTWGTVLALTAVRLACERSTASCVIVSTWGPFTGKRAVPLDSIRSTRLDAIQTKRTTSYGVILVTSAGDVPISSFTSTDRAQRASVKGAIDGFLSSGSAGIEVEYDEPHAGGVLIFALGLAWLLAGWFGARYARVEVDAATGTVDVVLVRRPASSQRRTFPLEGVRDAIVADSVGPKGITYSPALAVDGEDRPVPLFAGASSGRKPSEAVVRSIQALLTDARARVATARAGS